MAKHSSAEHGEQQHTKPVDFKGKGEKAEAPPEQEREASVDAGISPLLISRPRMAIQSSVCARVNACNVH